MRALTDLFIRRPVLAVVVNLAIALGGWQALRSLPVQQYPRLDSATIEITTIYIGASAEAVRGFLTSPIERAVAAVSGIDHLESTSRAGVSTITVHLELNHDTTAALAEITARLQQVRVELPDAAEPPTLEIRRADRPYASFYLSFSSPQRDVAALTDWLDRSLAPRLAGLPGVQRVSTEGGRPLALRVWLEPGRLEALGLTPGDVQAALLRNNYLAALGQLKGDSVQVDLLANTDLRTPEEFERLIVADRGGSIVRLADVARVELGAEEAELVAKFDQQRAVYLGIWPLPGSNELELAESLREELERLRGLLPADIEMRLAYDATRFMADALHEIGGTLLETIAIVAAVVLLFLGAVRTALVPLVAIPISLLGAAGAMAVLGFSLNLLTILALVLSVGLVVDDAIVVVENVERQLHTGQPKQQAALAAARELGGPIVAMTVTLVAVYAPLAFQGGLTGSLFLEFAIALAAAVLFSGVVALTLSPVMSGSLLRGPATQGRAAALVNRGFEHVRAAYAARLDGALELRWAIAAASLLGGAAAWPLLQYSRAELAPVEDQGHIGFFFDAAPDATLAAVDRASLQVVEQVHRFAETQFMWSLVAPWGGFGGMIAVDWHERARSTQELFGEVFAAVSQVPGLRAFPRLDPPLPNAGQYDVELVLQSDLPAEQRLAGAQAVVEAARRSGLFLYAETDLRIDLPEVRVLLDREALADLGLDLAAVGQELGALLGGAWVNRFSYFDRSYKVIPQLAAEDRSTLAPLLDLKVHTPAGELVPVSSFAQLQHSSAPRALSRFQQYDAARVFGAVRPGVTKEQGLRVLEAAARSAGGNELLLDYAGESRQLRREGSALVQMFGFSLVLIYLVLAAQFQSWRDPLIVLLGSVPLALAGALLCSFLGWTTVNIYSQVGLITLVGLIAKNGILIVQFANALQQRGEPRLAAVREASLTRLRPVLMTAAATVLGHLPLVLVSGPGAQARNSIGIVLVAGMSLGTLFTLFVVPAWYALIAAEHRPQSPAHASPSAPAASAASDAAVSKGEQP